MDGHYFITEGKINVWPGVKLSIKKKETKEHIGEIFILDFDPMYDYDKKIEIILESIEDYRTYDFLKETITVFLHNLKIEENFRNKGYGTTLKKEVEKIAKTYNYQYAASATKIGNNSAQKINKKLGYDVLKTFYDHDFFYKKI